MKACHVVTQMVTKKISQKGRDLLSTVLKNLAAPKLREVAHFVWQNEPIIRQGTNKTYKRKKCEA